MNGKSIAAAQYTVCDTRKQAFRKCFEMFKKKEYNAKYNAVKRGKVTCFFWIY